MESAVIGSGGLRARGGLVVFLERPRKPTYPVAPMRYPGDKGGFEETRKGERRMVQMDQVYEYGRHYDDEAFGEKVWRVARILGRKGLVEALTLFYALKDPDTPARARTLILGTLGYFVFPFDALPDLVPFVGYTDDLALLGVCLGVVAMHVKEEHRRQAETTVREWLG